MKTFVVGASGATGKLLVDQLLASGQFVKIVIRATSIIPDQWNANDILSIVRGNITDFSAKELSENVADCQAIACCLGHNMSLKGIYGKPRKLVADTVKLLCDAIMINAREIPVKFILMNTAGNKNRDLNEPLSLGHRMVLGLIRMLLPPHTDNEAAADYLRVEAGKNNPNLEWVVVRPDTLINEHEVTTYSLHPSPTRDAIFNSGKTSRINVAHFMAKLIVDHNLWTKWKGQMPVIYNYIESGK